MRLSILLFLFAILVIAGCNSNTVIKQEVTRPVVEDSLTPSQTNGVAPDNSYNSLDWQGTYTGILPCADCEGIETTITINEDFFYTLSTKYLGKKDSVLHVKKGVFNWNKEGSKITLGEVENAPSQYLVGENKLIQLDMKGNRITGESAVKYQLIKKN